MMQLRASELSSRHRLKRTEISVDGGALVHILGENGAGKSTLLLLLAGVLPADTGEIWINQRTPDDYGLSGLAAVRSVMAQQNADTFAVPVQQYLCFYCPADTVMPDSVAACLDIADLMQRPLTHLSGGERQRVEIARTLLQIWPALEQGQGLVCLDEPFSSLDIRHRYALVVLLKQLAATGNLVLLTSHDVTLSANYSDSVWLMKGGEVRFSGCPDEVLTSENLSLIYGCDMRVSHHQNLREIHVVEPVGKGNM
ncbi:ATP-binding cassette domain-containing protein [Alteromonas sp. CYL-A6]|uniref:ATP-binding cassette domain-containing protein n=1 Tax=Alteromonas nitratireducens TaxID=3390813 RepID=UPI0034B09154